MFGKLGRHHGKQTAQDHAEIGKDGTPKPSLAASILLPGYCEAYLKAYRSAYAIEQRALAELEYQKRLKARQSAVIYKRKPGQDIRRDPRAAELIRRREAARQRTPDDLAMALTRS